MPVHRVVQLNASQYVILTFLRLIYLYGKLAYIHPNNVVESMSTVVMKRWQRQKVGSADIKPGTPWRNGFVEIFKGKLRDECLNRGKFATRWEAKFVNEK